MTPERACGTCSLCCKVLDVVDPPALVKSAGVWCPHCKPGRGGCTIYATRPQLCATWRCQWLISTDFPDYWFPLRSHIVLNFGREEGEEQGALTAVVDPAYPNAWRRDPYLGDLRRWAQADLEGGFGYGVRVRVRDTIWQVLPNKEVLLDAIGDHGGVCIVRHGDAWELFQFTTAEEADAFGAAYRAFSARVRRDHQNDLIYFRSVVQPQLPMQFAEIWRMQRTVSATVANRIQE